MRTEHHTHTGTINAHITNPGGGDTEFIASPTVDRAVVTLTPTQPGDTVAEDRIRRAEISNSGRFVVRLPEMSATVQQGGGTTIVRNGGATVIQSAGTVTGTMVGATVINGNVVTGGMGAAGGSVTVAVHAPAGSALTARSSGGSIHQYGAATTVDADTSGGDIRIQHVTDEAELNTSGGDVRIGLAECRVEASTSGGDVRATDLRRGGNLRTSGGDVRACLSGDYPLKARTSGGDITLTTTGGVSEDRLSWHTSGGHVEVNDREAKQRS